ncbi:MAG: hypothetical protein O2820_12920 [Planctomycetota bacterium]|nr:hypothetical protein [Planctomycetota bacterium]MDA1250115.1 hypothetical protein [Planctomycetota bacterium]
MKWRLDHGQIEVVDEVIAEILRHKTYAERIQMISDAHETARHLVNGGVRSQHPTWNDDEVEAEVLRRLVGETG